MYVIYIHIYVYNTFYYIKAVPSCIASQLEVLVRV